MPAPDFRLSALHAVPGGSTPAVLVRDAFAACVALRLAPSGGVVLLSAPDAAGAMGAGWWVALVAAATAAVPGVAHVAALDCGAAAGHALAALRLGVRVVVLDPLAPTFPAVISVAAECGGVVWPVAPAAFDPGRAGLRRPAAQARLAAWLVG